MVIALLPWVITGCAATNSRLAKMTGRPAEDDDQIWARAQLYEKDGRYPEAQQLYGELYRRHPQTAKYAHRMGVAATMAGDHERASAAYNRAHGLEPDNADLLTDMGYAAFLRQNYLESERLLRAALAIAEDNPRATSNLALAVGFQGRYDESLALFRQVHGQDEAEVLCNLAYVKTQRGDTDEAAALYQQVLAIDPHVKKASVALAALKPAEPKTPMVAQQKPYRKYMNENKPTVTKSRPDAAVPVAQVESVPTDQPANPEITLTGQSEDQESSAEDDQSLTGWADYAAETTPAAPTAPKRTIPEEPVVKSQTAKTRSAAPMPVERQTVTAKETPIAVVEESVPIQAVLPDEIDQAFEDPEEVFDGWAAVRAAAPEPFGPEWLAARLEQIAERRGQAGFMSFCPVALRDEQSLVDALPLYTAEYQSQKYQFSSEAAQKKFVAQPERYLPAAGGLDVVAVSQGTAVAQGSLEHALWFRHKLYLFLTRENLEIFRTQARQFAVQQ